MPKAKETPEKQIMTSSLAYILVYKALYNSGLFFLLKVLNIIVDVDVFGSQRKIEASLFASLRRGLFLLQLRSPG